MVCQQPSSDLQQIREVLVNLASEHRGGAQQSPWATLAAGLPFAVAEPKSSRHALQEELIRIVAENLQSTKDATAAASMELEAKVQAAQADVEQGTERASAAQETETQSAEKLQQRQEEQKIADETVATAEQDRLEAEAIKTSTAKHLEECTQEHAEASSVAAGPLALLVEGGWEDEETRADVLAAVEDLLKRAGAEPTLLAAMHGTFRRKPAERGKFDQVVVSSGESAVAARVTALQKALDTSAITSEDANAEALGLWAIADLAKEAADKAKQAVSEAKASLGQAKRKRTEANSELQAMQQISQVASTEHNESEAKARRLSDALTALERLRTQEPMPAVTTESVETEATVAQAPADGCGSKIAEAAAAAAAVIAESNALSPSGGA
eukprot:TRINITY_DN18625_c0_g1_i3.p1 TRINITY_DN18625_c0_g1~~TRINITY_DN18625_c0_g1_i3.p1  ORF type:complete len:386 (-),score=111.79 TRINITY_DN18625_c0_g1_i3:371-1528(-)